MRRRIFMLGTANSRSTIDLGTLEVLQGELPSRCLSLVQEWAMIHTEELMEDWRLCRENAQPAKIDPLP